MSGPSTTSSASPASRRRGTRSRQRRNIPIGPGWRPLLARVFGFFPACGKNPSIVIYFLFYTVLIGGIGTWIAVIQHEAFHYGTGIEVVRNIATYLIAIAVTAFADYTSIDVDEGRPFNLLLLGLTILAVLSSIGMMFLVTPHCWFWFVFLGFVSTYFVWFVCNQANENLVTSDSDSRPNPALNTLGGNV